MRATPLMEDSGVVRTGLGTGPASWREARAASQRPVFGRPLHDLILCYHLLKILNNF